jgi:hypothetical protein
MSTWSVVSGGRRSERVWGIACLVLGAIGIVMGFVSIAGGDTSGVALMVIPVGVAVFGALYLTGYATEFRQKRLIAKTPTMLAPCVTVVSVSGVEGKVSSTAHTAPWGEWHSVVPLDDLLVLASGPTESAVLALLPRRGLSDPLQWDALVTFVTDRVEVHPDSPPPTVR